MSLICTHTLVGNLRLWSVISNMSRFIIENGHDEQGMKHKSCFITFYKFSVTVSKKYPCRTEGELLVFVDFFAMGSRVSA